MYIVGKVLKRGGKPLMPGTEIPEAVRFRNLKSYLNSGHILHVRDGATFNELDVQTRLRVTRQGLRDKLEANGVLGGAGASDAKVTQPQSGPLGGLKKLLGRVVGSDDPVEPEAPAETSSAAETVAESSESLTCDAEGCGRKFESAHGLEIHKGSAHK